MKFTHALLFLVCVDVLVLVLVAALKPTRPIPHEAAITLAPQTGLSGGMWLQPVRLETNQVFQPDGSSRREIQFIFKTAAPNVGGVVLSRQPGDKSWSMEAYHNARIFECVVGSLWFKDCRVLLIQDPDVEDYEKSN